MSETTKAQELDHWIAQTDCGLLGQGQLCAELLELQLCFSDALGAEDVADLWELQVQVQAHVLLC